MTGEFRGSMSPNLHSSCAMEIYFPRFSKILLSPMHFQIPRQCQCLFMYAGFFVFSSQPLSCFRLFTLFVPCTRDLRNGWILFKERVDFNLDTQVTHARSSTRNEINKIILKCVDRIESVEYPLFFLRYLFL